MIFAKISKKFTVKFSDKNKIVVKFGVMRKLFTNKQQ